MKKILITIIISSISSMFFMGEKEALAIEKEEKTTETIEYLSDNKLDNIKNLVTNFYRGFQDRYPDEDGLNYWANQIYKGNNSVAQVIESFIQSDEFINANLSTSEFIKRSYISLLGREPDEDGFNYWINKYENGYSKNYIIYSHFNSKEFQNLLKKINISNIGEIKITLFDKKPEIENLVSQFYKGFQRREADIDGLKFWTDEIMNGKTSISDVINSFIYSEEFINSNISDEQFIEGTYIALFGRKPDENGFNTWLNLYKSGYSKKYIIYNHFNSNEFKMILSNIGIKNVGNINLSLEDTKPEIKTFINSMYIGFFERNADEEGLNYWTDKVIKSEITIANLIENLRNSDEYKNKKYSVDDIIKKDYIALLGREADIDGLNYKLNLVMNGASNKYILHSIFYSNEFVNKVYNLGLRNMGDIYIENYDKPREGFAKGFIKNFNMNLRNRPSKNSEIITTLPIGTDVIILGRAKEDMDCYKIQTVINGKILTGYVSRIVDYKETIEIFSDDAENSNLGVLSEKYESNGNPGLISTGIGDYGGKSYGAWQFSSTMGSLNEFILDLKETRVDYYQRFKKAMDSDGNVKFGENFDAEWKKIADEDYVGFYNLQHDYIESKYYNSLVKRLFSVADTTHLINSFSTRNVLWSTAVQHGVSGSFSIIKEFAMEKDKIKFIEKVYGERGREDENGILVHFSKNSLNVQAGVKKRFLNEKNDAIRMLNNENGKKYFNKAKGNEFIEEVENIKISKDEVWEIITSEYGNDKDVKFVIDENPSKVGNKKGYKVYILSNTLAENGGNGYLFSVFVDENRKILQI